MEDQNLDAKERPEKSEIKKQNQDIQNIPASSQKIPENGGKAEEQIKKTSRETETGKTDNTEQN